MEGTSPILLTGVSGSLGRTLLAHLSRGGARIVGLYHQHQIRCPGVECRSMDLRRFDELTHLMEAVRPRTVVHCAAASDADWCEENPSEAWMINAEVSGTLARLTRKVGGRMVYFSTDLVFAGDSAPYEEKDSPAPLSQYGRTKLAGEEMVRAADPASLVLRVSLLYGWGSPHRGTCLDSLVSRLEGGNEVTLFMDQYRTPLWLTDAAVAVERALDQGAQGVYHLAGSERLSRYEFGYAVSENLGFPSELVVPGRASEYPFRAARPVDCSLSNLLARKELGLSFTSLPRALNRLKQNRPRTGPGGGDARHAEE